MRFRMTDLRRRLLAEGLGTAFLLISVVGSGIMGAALSGGNAGIALLANSVATGAMLYAIITTLGPVSGAHFNPAVTLAFALRKEIAPRLALWYVAAQITGGILGVWATHLMFGQPVFQLSATSRTGPDQWFAEGIATFGLLFVIFGGIAKAPQAVATLVALYITGAYWFTASTSFANPAVTVARSLSDTFAGIAPGDTPMFIVSQVVAVGVAAWMLPLLFPAKG